LPSVVSSPPTSSLGHAGDERIKPPLDALISNQKRNCNARLTIGDPGELPVEIPDAFFKILVHESPSGIDTLAFVFEQPNQMNEQGEAVPNATWVNCNQARAQNHIYDHRPQLVSIAQIEARTGLRFFPDRPNREALINAQATALWPVETRYWDSGNAVCARQRSHP
jgi:hypothetical protein